MPRRQLAVFTIGCYLALIAAALHMAGHLQGPPRPTNDTERQLAELASTYRFPMPGGVTRSMRDVADGFSLAFGLLIATIGGTGLIVARHGGSDLALVLGVARTFAAASVVLFVISLTHFFIVPTMAVATFALCFAMASVRPPAE